MAFYSRRHYRAVSPPSDTAADVAWRLKRNCVLAQVREEMNARFPQITAANFDAANEFQENRIAELMAEPGSSQNEQAWDDLIADGGLPEARFYARKTTKG